MQIRIDEIVSSKALKLIREFPEKLKKGVSVALGRAGLELQDEAVNLAPYKSGTLKGSIGLDPPLMAITNIVKVGTDVIYARIHDQGGVIVPKKKKWLRFVINGKVVFTKKVKIPKYKGRGYLTPAYQTQVKGRAKKIFEEELSKIIS